MTFPIEHVRLGPTGPSVPPFCVGAMFWGTRVPTATAHDLLDAAVDTGAPFIDTANNYAFWLDGATGDESETCLGEWFATRGPAARDRVVLATKLGARPSRPGVGTEDALGLHPDAVGPQLRDSLRRLRTDHVDVVYAHIDDPKVPMDEVAAGLRQLVDDGLTSVVAASNLTADRLQAAIDAGAGYVALQIRVTYLPPDPEAPTGRQVVLDDATDRVARAGSVTLVGYSPLLTGGYTRAERPVPDDYRGAGNADARQVLTEVTDGTGLDAGQVVLSWMVHREHQVVPVVGLSTRAQLDSAVTAVRTPLPADALARLDVARADAVRRAGPVPT